MGKKVSAKSERVVAARPEDVYTVLTDYTSKRPLILTPNFLDYAVEQGGTGTGTVVNYRLHAANRERPYRMHVEETVKNELLTERDSNSSLITTWTLLPQKDGAQTRVRVETAWEGSGGIGGFFERTFAPLGLRRIYADMLDLLKFLVQPANKKDDVVEEDVTNEGLSRAGMFLLIFALVIAFAYGINYFQQARNNK